MSATRLQVYQTGAPAATMKISYNTPKNTYDDLDPYHGFGNAARHVLDALKHLGYKWEFNDPTADVGFVFNHPSRAQFYPNQYNILYFPWESTEVPKGWKDVMDSVDELWTPSPWCADVFRNITTAPVYVYEHGIEKLWRPYKRERGGTLNFLHQGAEAARKNGWVTWDYMKQAFPNVPDIKYTMKYYNPLVSIQDTSRWKHINGDMKIHELYQLYKDNDVYVYPSAGEGFGLTPLQAIATGMPTITVKDWAPYADFLDPKLTLSGTLVSTTWQDIHPGQVYRIDPDELIDKLRYVYDNFDEVSQRAFEIAPKVHERYSWRGLTKDSFSDLEHRLNS